MLRPGPGVLALLLALSTIPAGAAPLQITGKVLHPPQDAQVELHPWSVGHAEALRRLKGEASPPIASARLRSDGSFALKVPDTGFYSVVARAPGRLAMEGFVPFVVEEKEMPPVKLPPTSPLEVRAVGADGQPLAGVTIQALPLKAESGGWRAAGRGAVTDGEGKAVFQRAEGEALTLVITTPGRYAMASTSPLGAGAASQTVRFPAVRTRMVEFRGLDGKPAAGTLVRLARRGWPYGLTGEDGRIPLPVPLEEEIGLFAEDSKGPRIEVVMTAQAGEGKDVPVVALRNPTVTAGRVLEAASREPIAGALVWNGGTAWTRTGPDGTFELRAPSGDQGQIQASAAGRMVHFQLWERERNAAITFLLDAAASISGRAVDEEGKPVEGARVTTLLNGEGGLPMEERSSTSGPDGGFLLRKVPAGRLHAVEAEREGFAPARQLADSTTPVRIVLRRGALAIGRILDEEGLPVAGAQVSLTPEGEAGAPSAYRPFQATADPDGRFRLLRVSAGRFDLRVESPGFAAVSMDDVLVPEQEAEVDLGEIRLPPGGAIEGILTDARGRPVEKAWVRLSPSDPEDFEAASRPLGRQPEIGPDGRFRIESLPRGLRVDIEVQHPQLLPAEVSGVEVPTAKPLRIRLESPRSLAGRVVDERGDPVAGATVQGSWDQARTDPEGRFVLSRLSPGKVDLQASAPGYRTRGMPQVPVPEDGDAEPVEIVLEAGTSLEGLVLDSEGRPVRHAHVRVSRRGEQERPLGSGMTDEEGRYEVVDLEPGPSEVVALLFERGGAVRVPAEILPGRNRLDLRMPAGVEVSGRVVDGRGEPVPGVALSLEPLHQEGITLGQQGMSAADGSFVLPDVTDGTYRLIATRSRFAPSAHPGEIHVDGAPVTGIEMRLSPGAVIRGRILGFRPEEVRSVSVHAVSEAIGIPLMGTVSPGPIYRIDDVAPGEWHVTAQVGGITAGITGGITVSGEVEVAAGAAEAVLDLELAPGFTVTGRVLLDREPLPGAGVSTNGQDGAGRREGTTGQDGAFRLEHVPGGSYALAVTLPQDSFHYQMVEIDRDLDLVVEISTGTIAGRLVRPEGLPVPGAAVTLFREVPEFQGSVPGPRAMSDEQGAFEILRVPAGTYKMTVQAEGFDPAESRVVVTPGGMVRLEIALGVSR